MRGWILRYFSFKGDKLTKRKILSILIALSLSAGLLSSVPVAAQENALPAAEEISVIYEGAENVTSVDDVSSPEAYITGEKEISESEEASEEGEVPDIEETTGEEIPESEEASEEGEVPDIEETTGEEIPESEEASEEGEVPDTEEATEEEISLISEEETTTGLGVASHTLEEIVTFLKNNNATFQDAVTYAETPSYTSPYSIGSLSQETKNSAIAMLNNVRYIAGLSADVTWSDSYEEKVQAGALISAANGTISHYPEQPEGMDDSLYKTGYSGCNSSNLSAGYGNLNRSIVEGWMSDSDSSNIETVGHRRWILNPTLGQTAFGAVTGTSTLYGSYYSMYCFDYSNTSATETKVAWPAQVMPLEYFGNSYPWSLSVGSKVEESAVSVKLTRKSDNKTWNFSSSSADGDFYVNNSNYGQIGCIIFRPNDISYSAGDEFEVTITGLSETISYSVSFFQLDDYWHVHDYTYSYSSSVASDYKTCTMTYKCKCGATTTKTYKTTLTKDVEPTFTEYGKQTYQFTDDYLGWTFSFTVTIPKLSCTEGKSYTVGSYKYKIVSAKTDGTGTVSITGLAKSVTEVKIPKTVTIKGASFKVVKIANNAFKNQTKITSASVGSNVTSIGSSAFYGCTKLKTVTGCSKVTGIGTGAFSGCSKLTSVAGCTKVTKISDKAFYKCKKLTTIGSKSKVITLAKVKTIGASAFYNCTALKKVNLTSTALTSIGSKAFYKCTAMTSFSESSKKVTKIESNAFYGDTKLATVTLKSTKLSSIGSKAFYGCKKLATVTIKSSKLTKSKVGSSAFKGIKSTCKFKVPSKKVSSYKKIFKAKGAGSKIKVVKA